MKLMPIDLFQRITIHQSISILTYDSHIDTMAPRTSMEKAKVKVSPKFQVVIPKAIREELKIEPGQELLIYSLEGSLRLDPRRPVRELRGIAKGMRWKDDYRDHAERY
jgi:AbrB family looped-hinge helix DNA binding protein